MRRRIGGALAGAMLLSSVHAAAAEKGTVTFVVRDDRGNDVDAKITLDADDTPIPLGRQQAIEPGIHDVRWSVSGASGVQKLTVIEGQQGRIFQIVTTAPASPPPSLAPPPSLSPPPPPPPSEPRASSPWPYILLGGGATLAVTSAVFQLVAINEDSDAQNYFWHSTRDDLSPSTTESLAASGRSHYDAAQTDQAVAITCGILAVTAVTVAVTWLVVGK